MTDLALLAPVPQGHLEAGQTVAAERGFVAFGSRKFELFRLIEERREGWPVPVLIYASHEEEPVTLNSLISWVGWYIGSEETHSGRHSRGMEHRPATTADNPTDNLGYWAVFWHVERLQPLAVENRFPLSRLQTIAGGWRKDAPPRGPELVARPSFVIFPE